MRKRKQNDEDQLTFDTMLVSNEAEPESDTYDIFGDIEQLLEKQREEAKSRKTTVSASTVDADSIFDDESEIKEAAEPIAEPEEAAEPIAEPEEVAEPIAEPEKTAEEEEAVKEMAETVETEESVKEMAEPAEMAESVKETEEVSEPAGNAGEASENEQESVPSAEASKEDIDVDIDREELLRKQKLVRFAKPDILLETPYTVTVGNKQYTRYRLEFGRPDAVIPPELSSSAGVLIPKIEEVDEEEAAKNKKELRVRGIVRELISWVSCITVAVLIALILTNFVFVFVKVEGDSMLHNLNTNNYLFVWRAGYIFASPERGDVVICNFPDENGEYENTTYIKRVVGLPGETISINNGYVYVDGRKLEEEYIEPSRRGSGNMEAIVLGENEYFVLGDNRINSTDSRLVGPIRKDKISGKALQVLYPFEEFAPVK